MTRSSTKAPRVFKTRSRVYSLAVDATGRFAAAGCQDRSIALINLRTGRTEVLEGHAGRSAVISVVFEPSGQYLWSATDGAKETIVRWRLRTRAVAGALGKLQRVWAIALAPDCTWLAAVGAKGTLDLLEIATGLTRFTVELPWSGTRLATDPSGQRIAVSGHQDLAVVDLASRRIVWSKRTRQDIGETLAWSGDGRFLVNGGNAPHLEVWGAETGAAVGTLTHEAFVNSALITVDEGVMAAGSTLFRLEPAKQHWFSGPELPFTGHAGRGGSTLVVADEDAKQVVAIDVSDVSWAPMPWASSPSTKKKALSAQPVARVAAVARAKPA